MKSMRELKSPSTYIKDIRTEVGYEDIITVEHRSNNPKRDFLFVNKNQCKHIPCSPRKMISMCKSLADCVNRTLTLNHRGENLKILVVGFAETATAIGTIVGEYVNGVEYIMHTTREQVEGSKQIITFEETHSHATTQLFLTSEKEPFDFDSINYILFVDDEISTGNTILNFINTFESQLNTDSNGHQIRNIHYGVASICNWQNSKTKEMFRLAEIDRISLIEGEVADIFGKMFTDEDELNKLMITTRAGSEKVTARAMGNRCSTKSNVFFSNRTGHYPHRTESSYSMQDKIKEIIKYLEEYKYLRIVGTEEFMEIPIKIGAELERKGHHVTVQATTRSKIDVLESYFDGEDSGIKSRYEVASAYESDRKNYIYNMDESSDAVVIMTDSHSDCDINKLVSDIEKISYGKTESVILIYI